MSEVWSLPSLWVLTRLEQCLHLNQSGIWGDEPRGNGSDHFVLRSTNIHEGQLILDEVAIRSVDPLLARKYALQDGDIIVTKSSGSPQLLGKNAVFYQPDNAATYLFANFTQRLRANPDLILPEYLYFYLNSRYADAFLERMQSTTSGLRNLSMGQYASQEVPLPPLPEQRRIVAILHKADALRQLRHKANARAHDVLPALFNEMFGDPVSNSMNWKTQPIREFGIVTTGNTPPRSRPEFFGDYIDWVKSDNLDAVDGIVGPTLEKLSPEGARVGRVVPKGSTLVTCIAGSFESIGKAAIADREVAFNQQINAVTPFDNVDPFFLYALISLSKTLIQAQSTTGMKKIVNKSSFEEVNLIAPSSDLQAEFGNRWEKHAHVVAAQIEVSTRSAALFDSLVARVFTGELTAAWRTAHGEELAAAAVERDRLLARREKSFFTMDADSVRVVAIDADLMTRTIAEEMGPAIQAIIDGMAANQLLEVVAQTAWQPLAERLQPIVADFAEPVSRALSEAMAGQNANMIGSLARAAQPLTESIGLSLAEAARSSRNLFSLALARDAAEIAAQIIAASRAPARQPDRSVRKALDISALSLLQAAEAGPAYFLPEDLVTDGRDEVEVEEGLQLLAALGFVRRVSVRGQYPYRLVDLVQDGVPPESTADETN